MGLTLVITVHHFLYVVCLLVRIQIRTYMTLEFFFLLVGPNSDAYVHDTGILLSDWWLGPVAVLVTKESSTPIHAHLIPFNWNPKR